MKNPINKLAIILAAAFALTGCSTSTLTGALKPTAEYTEQDCVDFNNRKLTYNLGAVADQLTGGYGASVLNLASLGVVGLTTKELYAERLVYCKDIIQKLEVAGRIQYSNGQIILKVQ